MPSDIIYGDYTTFAPFRYGHFHGALCPASRVVEWVLRNMCFEQAAGMSVSLSTSAMSS